MKIKELGKTFSQLDSKQTKEVFKEWKKKRLTVEEFMKQLKK